MYNITLRKKKKLEYKEFNPLVVKKTGKVSPKITKSERNFVWNLRRFVNVSFQTR